MPTFVYYFSGTALATTFLAVKTLGVGPETGIPSGFGLLFGLLGGLVGAYFNQSQVLEVPFTNRPRFLKQLEAVLAEKGYSQSAEADLEDILVFQRPALRQLFSGKVYVQLVNQKAVIASRATHLRWLKQQLTLRDG